MVYNMTGMRYDASPTKERAVEREKEFFCRMCGKRPLSWFA